MATVLNGSFALPAANANYIIPGMGSKEGEVSSYILSGMNIWSLLATLLVSLIAYDQSRFLEYSWYWETS